MEIEDISKKLDDVESNQMVMINRLLLIYDLLTTPEGKSIIEQAKQNTLKEVRGKIIRLIAFKSCSGCSWIYENNSKEMRFIPCLEHSVWMREFEITNKDIETEVKIIGGGK